jgi:hypothetical protein
MRSTLGVDWPLMQNGLDFTAIAGAERTYDQVVAALDAQYGSSSSNGDTGIEGARRDASISTRDAQYYASRDTSWASTLNSSTSLGTSPWIVKERTSANAQAAYSTNRANAQAAHDAALLSAIDNWQTSNLASTLSLLLAEGQSREAYNQATANVYANWEMGVGNLLGDKPAGTDWKTGGTIADGVKTTGASGETNNHRLFERGFSETPGNSQRSGQVKNEDLPSLPATTTIAVPPKSEPLTESEPEEVYVQDWWGQQYKVNNNYFAIGVGVFGARVIWWWSITPDRNRHCAPTSPGSGYSSDSISQIIRSSALDDAQKELNRKTWMEMEANAKTNEQVVRGFRAMQTFGKEQAAFEAEVLINGYAEFCASATGIAQSCSHGIIGLPGIRRGGDAAETAANSADNLPLGKLADDAPDKVNGRMPINADYVGKTYFDALPMRLQKKYPNGVKFDSKGFPDFSPYSKKSVEIKYTGSRTGDIDAANKAAGFFETPKGYTWHHHQDVGANGVGRMELVPSDLHSEVRHTGGVARWQELFPGQGSY